MLKRVGLFLLTNILVVVTISILLNILGVGRYLTSAGLDYTNLMIFCLLWGFVGSFISLFLSKKMAKFSLGIQVVDKNTPRLGWVAAMVEQLAMKAGLPKVPEVGVYDSAEVNAFATGPSQRNSLVAFSTGLLTNMSQNEIEGVAAHEIAHIKNGDMVTMTLLQGVINAFVMFLARAIAFALTMSGRSSEERSGSGSMMMVTFVLEIVLGLLGTMVVMAFSRWREFRADRGGAQYAGREDMVAALERLRRTYELRDPNPSLAAFKISGGVGRFFASHPPLEQRIAALRALPQ